MKKGKLLAILILIISFTNIAFAQSEIDNHKKYWYYKTRLNNDFLKVGFGSNGLSIPFNERGYEESFPYFAPDVSHTLKAGDASARLGIYISVLATEYRLLKNNGQNVSKVKHELFCALSAINRMDYYAEQIFRPTLPPNLNGFFIRDDIPEHFVSGNFKHFNYYNNDNIGGFTPNTSITDRGFTQTFESPMYKTESTMSSFLRDYYDPTKSYEQALHSSEESQDQVYYLLMGLTLTSKLIDDGETDGSNVFGYGSGEDELVKESINITSRLINHIKSDPIWTIRNPANGDQPVQIGQSAAVYSYALDNLGAYIKHNQDMPAWHIPIVSGLNGSGIGFYPHANSTDFRNLYSASPAATIPWQTIANAGGGPSVDQQGFFNALAGCGNNVFEQTTVIDLGIQQAINALQNQINDEINNINQQVAELNESMADWVPNWLKEIIIGTIQFLLNGLQILIDSVGGLINTLGQYLHPSILLNNTDAKLTQNSVGNQVLYPNDCLGNGGSMAFNLGSEEYFGIYLRDILHGPNQDLPSWIGLISSAASPGHLIVKNNVEEILSTAPCEGNYNFAPNYPSGDHWGASNFLDRPDRLWVKQSCPAFLGEYAGLDYMLIHNLYYLREGNTSPFYNYSERDVIANMPYSNGEFSLTNKKTLGAFEFIDANNIINSNGAADYRAGKQIDLKPGFTAKVGSDFHAYVDPYNCSGIGNQMSRVAGGNTSVDYYGPTNNLIKQTTSIPKQQTKEDNQLDEYVKQVQMQIAAQKDTMYKEIDRVKSLIANYAKSTVYPNPNTGTFIVKFNLEKEQHVKIKVVDLVGKTIHEQEVSVGSEIYPVKLDESWKGVFMLKLIYENDKVETHKITIQ